MIMKKNITIILDPAHGEDVPGKRSPDGVHREYRWLFFCFHARYG